MVTPGANLENPVRARHWLAIGSACLCVLLGALDTYVVVSVLRDIVDDMNVPLNRLEQATPIVTGYLLGYIAAMPLLGQASDRFGRKPMLHGCLALFLVGSVLTALATDLDVLIAARVVQGVASGALLPMTLALAADLWPGKGRSEALGITGAAQELGSVLGPVYGLAIAGLSLWASVFGIAGWRGVFWLNVPLCLLAMAAIQIGLPRRSARTEPAPRQDVVGGVLLGLTLGLIVVGLQNPEPDKQLLPSWGVPVLIAAAISLVVFVVWEWRSPVKLIDPRGARMGPFMATLGVSMAAGAGLMVMLVDMDLLAQTVLGKSQQDAVFLLLRFLVALPIGAVAGGWLAGRVGDRIVSVAGMLLAALGFWLVSGWPMDAVAARYDLLAFTVSRTDVDLALTGIGLGLVIAPLSAAALKVVPETQHGIAAAGVVVARMTGMLVGIAALSAFGLYRFHQLTSTPIVQQPGESTSDYLKRALDAGNRALLTEYHEIFAIAAVICLAGAAGALFIRDRVAGPAPGHEPATQTSDLT